MLGREIGRYRIEGEIGRGGMGVVYRATQTTLGRTVAVKMLSRSLCASEEYLARFRREAETLARLAHPNIVHIYDVEDLDGAPLIIMEYVEGPSLGVLLRREGRLHPARARDIAAALADGLAAAHRQEIVHRDIKPDNVLFTPDGRPKLTDFGIAHIRDSDMKTRTGAMLGTPHYMAPEQASGDPVSPASDVYSLGVLLFEMLSGRVPFTGDTPVAVAMKHLREEPPSLRRLAPGSPRELCGIVERALRKDPGRRFASAGAMGQTLRRLDLGHAAGAALLLKSAPERAPAGAVAGRGGERGSRSRRLSGDPAPRGPGFPAALLAAADRLAAALDDAADRLRSTRATPARAAGALMGRASKAVTAGRRVVLERFPVAAVERWARWRGGITGLRSRVWGGGLRGMPSVGWLGIALLCIGLVAAILHALPSSGREPGALALGAAPPPGSGSGGGAASARVLGGGRAGSGTGDGAGESRPGNGPDSRRSPRAKEARDPAPGEGDGAPSGDGAAESSGKDAAGPGESRTGDGQGEANSTTAPDGAGAARGDGGPSAADAGSAPERSDAERRAAVEEIREVVERQRRATESGELELFLSDVAPDLRDTWAERFRAMHRDFTSIRSRVGGLEVRLTSLQAAHAEFRVRLSGRRRGDGREVTIYDGPVAWELARIDDGWKIVETSG